VKFVEFLSTHSYCKGLMILIALVTFIISLKYYGRHRILRIFSYYLGFSLLQSAVDCYRHMIGKGAHIPTLYALIVDTAFLVFEFSVCTLFILQFISAEKRRLILKINTVLYFVLLALLFVLKFPDVPFAWLFLLQSIVLVPPCLVYFYELFITVNSQSLKDQPPFWIVTGILFLNSCSIPLYLSLDYLGRYADSAFALNDILYSIFFILMIRAYRCNSDVWYEYNSYG